MKLQLALDRLTRGESIRILESVKQYVDIIEVGTGVIKEYGVSIIKEIRDLYPDKTILMGFAANPIIKETLQVAKEMDGQMMVDLLEIQSADRVRELSLIGVELVSLHVGKDKQTEGVFHTDLFSLIEGVPVKVAVAGGINLKTLPEITQHKPDIVIIGSAITGQDNPELVAKTIKNMMQGS
ncbi:D-arabino 3-hexulose 6-phosphate formaldehyde lyase [Oceanobacillus iheyensis HTE831]|uniref:D-arabino 3-hexulose 6-phosphate formaldehyde lyase n=1 Tax=Oceanobacillus iheyensis (strain DSM 14371 / CIP 107618 / JCM 11309 / KCTC 3954 / HTE831) TaxID=221109 RepID=Q8EMZ3_OCEIH|nr:orotidine 5'-phosphate decarboxylase / HUMPS family protein [Oceanobacillus iheyensis]BAC14653.1 D-arabino 3-hexulose 6-phosphate formaldehyde lyase [Oceanobacillus iheyensis HTE831]